MNDSKRDSDRHGGPPAQARDADAAGDALSKFAARVRRLVDATVSIEAPSDVLDAASRAVADVVASLEPWVPEPLPPRYPGAIVGGAVNDIFPYDVVLGRLNPIAVPMEIEWRDPLAIGRVRFGTPYEGPPGCVHGAVIAGAFDQVFNAVNLMRGNPGPTRKLEIRYRKPTPLREELPFEACQVR